MLLMRCFDTYASTRFVADRSTPVTVLGHCCAKRPARLSPLNLTQRLQASGRHLRNSEVPLLSTLNRPPFYEIRGMGAKSLRVSEPFR